MEGFITPTESTTSILFTPKYISKFKAIFGVGAREVRAYGCARCGHLQLAVTFSEGEQQHFLKFEGQQHDVLQRLSEETDVAE
ncbi:MAG: hypothetical protein ACJ741_17005 [Pyrinomonadaceae bacterium]